MKIFILFFVCILHPGAGIINSLNAVYCGFLEWSGWAVFGRICYCAYIVHVTVIRVSTANHTSLLHANFLQMLLTYFAHVVSSFVVALPCWMLIEAPFNHIVKLCFCPAPKEPQEDAASIKIAQKETDQNIIPVFVISKMEKELDGTVGLKL